MGVSDKFSMTNLLSTTVKKPVYMKRKIRIATSCKILTLQLRNNRIGGMGDQRMLPRSLVYYIADQR